MLLMLALAVSALFGGLIAGYQQALNQRDQQISQKDAQIKEKDEKLQHCLENNAAIERAFRAELTAIYQEAEKKERAINRELRKRR